MLSISTEPIDAQSLTDLLADAGCGAVVTFEGRVRNHNEGRAVRGLEYETHKPLAVAESARIFAEARERFGLLHALCVHRVGPLEVGDIAVWVGVSSAHRGEAFDACRYIIDQVKLRLPIWKKEHYADGSVEWVNCSHAEENSKSAAGHFHDVTDGQEERQCTGEAVG